MHNQILAMNFFTMFTRLNYSVQMNMFFKKLKEYLYVKHKLEA